MELLYKELTGKIRKDIYDVHNNLGVGYDEETYHQGLIRQFKKSEIPFVSKERKWLMHRNIQVRRFELDFIAYNKIIVLLKCFQHGFIKQNFIQMIAELKLWQRNLGLMVNFGLPRVNIKRIPFTEKPKEIWEDYSYVKAKMTYTERKIMLQLRKAILFVYNSHGLGFGRTVYKKLVETELKYQKNRFQKRHRN